MASICGTQMHVQIIAADSHQASTGLFWVLRLISTADSQPYMPTYHVVLYNVIVDIRPFTGTKATIPQVSEDTLEHGMLA